MKRYTDREERPLYLQLYEKLRQDILDGNYAYHTKLPSKRTLSAESGVSVVTVEHAYALLCEEGYAQARERSGYVVIFRASDGFAASGTPSLKTRTEAFLPSETSAFPLSVLSKTMRKVLAERGAQLLEKSPNCGCSELKEALCHYLARNRSMQVDAEQIVIGAGSEYLYGLIVKLLGTGRVYAIEEPSYKKIKQVYAAAEVAFDSLPLTNSGIDTQALFQTSAEVLHTTPYRSYPSGVTASATKRHEYIRWANAGDRYIIEDDFESEFSVAAKPVETLFSLSGKDNVIYLNTFSKTISPSLRLAYMVLPKRLANEFLEKFGFYSCTVSAFLQYVVAELLANGDFERHINRVRRNKRKELSL